MLKTDTGLTLLELLVAVSIATVLATIAIPSMRAVIADARLASAIDIYASLLTRARSEAINRNEKVTLCPTTDGIVCGEANSWHLGVMAFADRNANRQRDGSEPLLRYQPLKSGISIF